MSINYIYPKVLGGHATNWESGEYAHCKSQKDEIVVQQARKARKQRQRDWAARTIRRLKRGEWEGTRMAIGSARLHDGEWRYVLPPTQAELEGAKTLKIKIPFLKTKKWQFNFSFERMPRKK
jgi:hypothetical protein